MGSNVGRSRVFSVAHNGKKKSRAGGPVRIFCGPVIKKHCTTLHWLLLFVLKFEMGRFVIVNKSPSVRPVPPLTRPIPPFTPTH